MLDRSQFISLRVLTRVAGARYLLLPGKLLNGPAVIGSL